MRNTFKFVVGLGLASFAAGTFASPQSDLNTFQNFYKKQFPNVEFQDFANGAYSIDPAAREQWLDIEEFPPYEMSVDEGEKLFKAKFKNGKSIADCFGGDPTAAAQYPKFDSARGEVVTLELAVNECRVMNDEDPWGYGKGKITSVMGYMAYQSRGKTIKVDVSGAGAEAAYEDGKKSYYTRRGQLNMACAHCHIDSAGKRIRSEILSMSLGHPTHFPVYRTAWNELGSLHRRFTGCNEQVRARKYDMQSREYRNLEFFLTYMSNGLQWNGPSTRK